MDKESLNEKRLGFYFKELTDSEAFRAQLQLEEQLITSSASKLQCLPLDDKLVGEYTRCRAKLDAIKELQKMRLHYIESLKS